MRSDSSEAVGANIEVDTATETVRAPSASCIVAALTWCHAGAVHRGLHIAARAVQHN